MKNRNGKDRSGLERLLGFTRELIALAVTLALVLLAALMIVNRDRLNLDVVNRWVAYGTLDRDESGRTEEFDVSGDSTNVYTALGENLVVCTGHELQVFTRSGRSAVRETVNLNAPIIHSEGGFAVVYDVGGQNLYVLHNSEVVYTYSAPQGCQILSARVNAAGYLVLVEQTSGHKATVTVYDEKYQPRIGINESTNFVSDAVLSPDSKTVAVLEFYQSKDAFGSDLVLYSVKDAAKLTTSKLGEDLVIDLRWKGERIWAQRESGLTVLDKDGNILNTWKRSNKYLTRYCLDGIGYAVEYLSKYRSGGAGELRIIGADGEQTVSRSINEEVLSISAAGRYVAVLSTNSLMIFKDDLQEYASLGNQSSRRALMRGDGSVVLLGSEKARLYIPS